jgi:hypothetical protein
MVFNEPVTYVSEHPLPMFPGHTLVPAIHVLTANEEEDVDARDKRGHDESE